MKKTLAAIVIVAIAAVFSHPLGATAQTTPDIFSGRDMYIGVSGTDVTMLQGLLSELGYLTVPQGVPLGYFGSLTQSALAQYQASIGVINTGYYGPLTKDAMKSHFASRGWLELLYPNRY